jgi:hypothetical protein
LPVPVTQIARKAYSLSRKQGSIKFMKPDNTETGYEVVIKSGGKEIELEVELSGKILYTENE